MFHLLILPNMLEVHFSSSASQTEDGSIQRDFRKMLCLAQATEALLYFTRSQLDILVSSACTIYLTHRSLKCNGEEKQVLNGISLDAAIGVNQHI